MRAEHFVVQFRFEFVVQAEPDPDSSVTHVHPASEVLPKLKLFFVAELLYEIFHDLDAHFVVVDLEFVSVVEVRNADWITGPFFVFVIFDAGEQRFQKIIRFLQPFYIFQNALL